MTIPTETVTAPPAGDLPGEDWRPQTALYRLYDAGMALLYVGITDNLTARMATHARDKSWWSQVAHRRVVWFDERADAVAAERQAIQNERPLHNVLETPLHRERARDRQRLLAESPQMPAPDSPLAQADFEFREIVEYHRVQMSEARRLRGQRLLRERDAGRTVQDIAVEIGAHPQVVYDLTREARTERDGPQRGRKPRKAVDPADSSLN